MPVTPVPARIQAAVVVAPAAAAVWSRSASATTAYRWASIRDRRASSSAIVSPRSWGVIAQVEGWPISSRISWVRPAKACSRLRRNGTGVRKSPASRSGVVVIHRTLAATTDIGPSAENPLCAWRILERRSASSSIHHSAGSGINRTLQAPGPHWCSVRSSTASSVPERDAGLVVTRDLL